MTAIANVNATANNPRCMFEVYKRSPPCHNTVQSPPTKGDVSARFVPATGRRSVQVCSRAGNFTNKSQLSTGTEIGTRPSIEVLIHVRLLPRMDGHRHRWNRGGVRGVRAAASLLSGHAGRHRDVHRDPPDARFSRLAWIRFSNPRSGRGKVRSQERVRAVFARAGRRVWSSRRSNAARCRTARRPTGWWLLILVCSVRRQALLAMRRRSRGGR